MRSIVESCLDKNPDNRPNAQTLLMWLLGHDGPDAGTDTESALREGEQIAQTGVVTGGQVPFTPPPPGPSMIGQPDPHGGPGTSDPRMGQPGTSNPRPGTMGPPGISDPRPGFGAPTNMSNPRPSAPGYPQAPPGAPPHATPPSGAPGGGMNPNQTFARPSPQQPVQRSAEQNSVLQQSWVIPAVLMTIVILVLTLFLVALNG